MREHDVAEQGAEADEGRLEAWRGMVGGGHRGRAAILNGGAGARPSQPIASVVQTTVWRRAQRAAAARN
jgi:hypothetical protein